MGCSVAQAMRSCARWTTSIPRSPRSAAPPTRSSGPPSPRSSPSTSPAPRLASRKHKPVQLHRCNACTALPVPMRPTLSAYAPRAGEIKAHPCVETVQYDAQCAEVIAPARITDEQSAVSDGMSWHGPPSLCEPHCASHYGCNSPLPSPSLGSLRVWVATRMTYGTVTSGGCRARDQSCRVSAWLNRCAACHWPSVACVWPHVR
jgi:hypothetical protein